MFTGLWHRPPPVLGTNGEAAPAPAPNYKDLPVRRRRARVLIFGLTPLAVAVAQRLREMEADVTVVPDKAAAGTLAEELRELGVDVASFRPRRDTALEEHLFEETPVLALADDPVENLKTAVAAHKLMTDTDVVIHTFDRAFADRLEQDGLSLDPVDEAKAFCELALAVGVRFLRLLNLLDVGGGSGRRPGSVRIGCHP